MNLMQHCFKTKMFNTWIVILASVQSNIKRKKATSVLDFFGSTSVERESRKTFAKRENRWITNYSCFAHNFFLKKKSGILCIVNSTSCIMHWTGKTLNLTIPCLSVKFMHHMLIFRLSQAFLVDPLPICYSYIRMNYSEHSMSQN